jgi:DNA-binding NarL/FixJ family response regulator
LRSTLKESALNAERENMYAAFDQTFLKLFPQFVERYNALFEEDDRKLPADEESLTSEMRIFALIRLGITDSERIANFLNYSVHTVNTYKTRIKNRSFVANEEFERMIMEI